MLIKQIAKLISDKINANELSLDTYVSTENLLSNFGGIKQAVSLPNTQATKFIEGDILLSNIRPYFKKTWYALFSGGCSSDVLCLRVDSNIANPKYIYYVLNTSAFVKLFVGSSKGTKMPRGDRQVLLNYSFKLPNKEIQQHIVDTIHH
ncbi:MAG: restriction endonuclease subunit S [Candidatus Cloacimonetes bacterium]|nr:restriction endonuclease subunit S [Candidatus Cloacimonadota bacterium]